MKRLRERIINLKALYNPFIIFGLIPKELRTKENQTDWLFSELDSETCNEEVVKEIYVLGKELFNNINDDLNRVVDKAYIAIGIHITIFGLLLRYIPDIPNRYLNVWVITGIVITIITLIFNTCDLTKLIMPKPRMLLGKQPNHINPEYRKNYLKDFLIPVIDDLQDRITFNKALAKASNRRLKNVVNRLSNIFYAVALCFGSWLISLFST